MRRHIKVFVENRWYKAIGPGQFEEIPASETKEGPGIEKQIADWVDDTDNIIVSPGQLGMHTSWHGDSDSSYKLKCITFGLTILYQGPDDE